MFKFFAVVALTVAWAPGALAQPARSAAASSDDVLQARYNIFTMEGVLERAVEQGADSLRRQVRRLMPDMLLMSGAAEARGFRLEGYGVFFDVEVPVLRRSIAWSLRTMIDENGVGAMTALQQLKSLVESLPDPQRKANLLQAVKRLELQVGPPRMPGLAPSSPALPPRASVTAAAVDPMAEPVPAPAPAPVELTPAQEALITNPSEVYEKEVVNALVHAMLEYSGPIGIGSEEWLTVAARDNEHRDRMMPGDPYDLMTIVLRIKGSDLAAYRGGRLTKEEARKRVEVREF